MDTSKESNIGADPKYIKFIKFIVTINSYESKKKWPIFENPSIRFSLSESPKILEGS
jgi:hypothetical protein